ncbi:hypothetical protein TSUD_46880 [Trifolium subterraneum]|nr:hypothetical protein TSUD_46880 [Trifolium subterraneum]
MRKQKEVPESHHMQYSTNIIGIVIFTMATTFKGICKSLKYITQMFVVKEREMEIGYPTDVKHVAHGLGSNGC